MTDPITSDQALDAGARLIAELIGGLAKTPEGRTEVILSLIAGLPLVRLPNPSGVWKGKNKFR